MLEALARRWHIPDDRVCPNDPREEADSMYPRLPQLCIGLLTPASLFSNAGGAFSSPYSSRHRWSLCSNHFGFCWWSHLFPMQVRQIRQRTDTVHPLKYYEMKVSVADWQ